MWIGPKIIAAIWALSFGLGAIGSPALRGICGYRPHVGVAGLFPRNSRPNAALGPCSRWRYCLGWGPARLAVADGFVLKFSPEKKKKGSCGQFQVKVGPSAFSGPNIATFFCLYKNKEYEKLEKSRMLLLYNMCKIRKQKKKLGDYTCFVFFTKKKIE